MALPLRPPPPPAPRRALAALLLLAAGVRLAAWLGERLMTNDGPDFLWQAQRMLAGDWTAALSHPYHPLYALLSAAAGGPLRDVLAGALIVSIGSGVITVLAVHAIARHALPERPTAALAAALIAALHTPSVARLADVRSDALYVALFALAIATLLGAVRDGGWRWAAAGATIAACYLTRPEGLFLLLPAGLALFARARRRGPRPAVSGAIAGALGLLLAAPYPLLIHARTDAWALSMKPSIARAGLGGTASLATLPRGCPLASPLVRRVRPAIAATDTTSDAVPVALAKERDEAPAAAGIEAPPSRGALASLRESLEQFSGALRLDTLAFVLLGLAAVRRARPGLLAAGLIVLGGWIAVAAWQVHASGYLDARHMLAPAQLLLPLAGAGWLALWNARRIRAGARVLALTWLLLLAAADVHSQDAGSDARLQALAFAAARTPADAALVVPRRRDGWYARRPVVVVLLPCRESDLLATMDRERATLLVLDATSVRRDEPGWLESGPFRTVKSFGAGDDAVLVLERRG